MRKVLLTSAALAALTLAGNAVAQNNPIVLDSSTPPTTEISTSPAVVALQEAAPPESLLLITAQAQPVQSAEDFAVAEQLRNLIENKLAQYVQHQQDRAGVEAFYRKRNFSPLWVASGAASPRVQQAAQYLSGVAADGLDPADYPTPRFADNSPERLAVNELTMTNSVVSFVRHASIGRVAFSRVSGAVHFDRQAPDPADTLATFADSPDLRATLDSFQPQHAQYKALKAALPAQRSQGHDAAGSSASIIANMERWRWMPHDFGDAYVMVNVPDYTLKVMHQGKMAWSTRIVVGKPGSYATPIFTETMKYITVNPTWNVPPSIIRNEYLPALAQDPSALARSGLRIGRNADGSIRIYQPPGEANALGRIRFNFPNRFLVYQHDTPNKHLFEHSTRAYSHGCMRVQNPDQYAEALLSISQPEERYTATRIRSQYGLGERTITFKRPIPVYVTYQTAFVDESGKLQSRPDIYGLDKSITAQLDDNRRVANVPVARNRSASSRTVRAQQLPSTRRSASANSTGFTGNMSNYVDQPYRGRWGGTYAENWRGHSYAPTPRFRTW